MSEVTIQYGFYQGKKLRGWVQQYKTHWFMRLFGDEPVSWLYHIEREFVHWDCIETLGGFDSEEDAKAAAQERMEALAAAPYGKMKPV